MFVVKQRGAGAHSTRTTTQGNHRERATNDTQPESNIESIGAPGTQFISPTENALASAAATARTGRC